MSMLCHCTCTCASCCIQARNLIAPTSATATVMTQARHVIVRRTACAQSQPQTMMQNSRCMPTSSTWNNLNALATPSNTAMFCSNAHLPLKHCHVSRQPCDDHSGTFHHRLRLRLHMMLVTRSGSATMQHTPGCTEGHKNYRKLQKTTKNFKKLQQLSLTEAAYMRHKREGHQLAVFTTCSGCGCT